MWYITLFIVLILALKCHTLTPQATDVETQKSVKKSNSYALLENATCIDVFDDTLVASPRSCRHYFHCYEDSATEKVCLPGYAFNEEQQICDDASRVDCILCPRKGHYAFTDPKNCNYFYRCDNGVRDLMACPFGLRFDEAQQMCLSRYETKCNVENICRHNSHRGKQFYVGDPNDCRKCVLIGCWNSSDLLQ